MSSESLLPSRPAQISPAAALVRLAPKGKMSAARLWSLIRSGLTGQVGRFAFIGVLSTLAYLAVYALLRASLSAQLSNALALLLTTFGNTLGNRHLTFGATRRSSAWRDQAVGLVGLVTALIITSSALWLLAAVGPQAGRLVEMTVLVFANGAATVARFLILRAHMAARPSA
jgi:putative flippase GtrA